MAFPPAHFLIGCGFGELARTGSRMARWKAWALSGCMAVAPDLDIMVGVLIAYPSAYHGTFSHSIFAIVAVGLLIRMLAGARAGLVAGAGYGSHLLVDLLDSVGTTNVLLGWPFSNAPAVGIARIVPMAMYEKGNGIWAAAASLLEPPYLYQHVMQALFGAAVLLLLLALGFAFRWVSGLSRHSTQLLGESREGP